MRYRFEIFAVSCLTQIKGVIPAMPTFFKDTGDVCYSDLQLAVDFAIRCKVSGIAVLVIGGEFYKLSEGERKRIASASVKATQGRMPVYVGVSHSGLPPAIDLAKHAENIGADGVILTTPYFTSMRKEIEETKMQFIRVFCDKCKLPVILQFFNTDNSIQFSLKEIDRLLGEFQNIKALKIEGEGSQKLVRELHTIYGSRISILGGKLGINLPEEIRDGVSGTIPGLSFSDIIARAFTSFKHNWNDGLKTLSLLNPYFHYMENHFDQFVAIEKELLRLRNVIKNPGLRLPGLSVPESETKNLSELIRLILVHSDS